MRVIPNRLDVLLADDDPNDILLIRRAFRRLGGVARLTVVPDGEQAVAYVLGEKHYADRASYPFPHVLVLDHRMPRLSGLGVLCWLRENPLFTNLPVLVFSLTLLPSETEAITRLQGASCVKPMDWHETLDVIVEGINRAFVLVGKKPLGIRTEAEEVRLPAVVYPPRAGAVRWIDAPQPIQVDSHS